MNDFVKGKIKYKNQLYKIHTKNDYRCNDYLWLQAAEKLVSKIIARRKENHNFIASKLNNLETTRAKLYWSTLLKTIYNFIILLCHICISEGFFFLIGIHSIQS